MLPFLAALALWLGWATVCPSQTLEEEVPVERPSLIDLLTPAPVENLWHYQADYLIWFLKALPVPPLVTTGPAGSLGIVGQPGTEILRGGDLPSRHGRYVGGLWGADGWLNRDANFGLDGSVFLLERDSSNITFPHTTSLIARPYIDANTGQQSSYIIAGFNPDFGNLRGSINVYSRIELFGEDVSIMYRWATGPSYQICFLLGAQFLQMRERLDITASAFVLPAESTLIGMADHFQTFDRFYGCQTGCKGEWHFGRFFIEGRSTIALGADDQIIAAKGDRNVHTPRSYSAQTYGLYVLPSNTGTFERGEPDFVTETTVNMGLDLTRHIRLHGGYSIILWNNPVRPGDQIDAINLSQVSGKFTGPLRPIIPFRTSFFWAQGVNAGVEIRW
ncbi:MAG TPA: BBP7 family outer membrane beta-barrel protein [Gemmataceae bacterium]|nr:BBP7 family outer membrane beta-barrel protein [Gemmataceae bacterium]